MNAPLDGKMFVLVGAGGAGRALAFGARSRGARVVVFDIDFGRTMIKYEQNVKVNQNHFVS